MLHARKDIAENHSTPIPGQMRSPQLISFPPILSMDPCLPPAVPHLPPRSFFFPVSNLGSSLWKPAYFLLPKVCLLLHPIPFPNLTPPTTPARFPSLKLFPPQRSLFSISPASPEKNPRLSLYVLHFFPVHSYFFYFFLKYLLSSYYVPGIALDARNTTLNNASSLCPPGSTSLVADRKVVKTNRRTADSRDALMVRGKHFRWVV